MEKEILLEVNHLSKKFGDQTILKDISLTLRKSEVIVIIGPSGCGKSTFLRCLNGLESVSGGDIILEGQKSPTALCPMRNSAKKSEWFSKAMIYFPI